MIHASWVCVACVARAMPGRATFSDDMAATTVASARHTTRVTTPGRRALPDGDFMAIATRVAFCCGGQFACAKRRPASLRLACRQLGGGPGHPKDQTGSTAVRQEFALAYL